MQKKKIFIIGLIVYVITALALGAMFISSQKTTKLNAQANNGLAYNEVTDANADIANCEYVKFNSFFIKDTDGDGYAERWDGTCNQLSQKATLYFDINVLTDGKLENGKITINGRNFNLSTTLVKDEVMKNDYIGENVTQLQLNDINYGTQKLFSGKISSKIGNNINNYSNGGNTVTLTGTWVSTDGTRTEPIEKVINLRADWYGKTTTESYPYITTSHNLNGAVGEEEVTLSFEVGYRERAEELLIQKQLTELDIPQLAGYSPTEVTVTSQNCTFDYNQETRRLTIERNATVSESGNITNNVSRTNTYTVKVKYPKEAYENLGTESISITVPTTGYYYGYNNSNSEFDGQNPYISQASRTWTHTWSIPQPVEIRNNPRFYSYIGRYVYNPDTKSYRYIISKKLPLNIYNNVGQTEGETDDYVVQWEAYTGNTFEGQNGISMEERQNDQFKNVDGNYIDMKEYTKTKAIYFSNIGGLLEDDGWIKLYDSETNELINTFTKDTWSQYTSSNPYNLEKTVKSIKVETSKACENSYFHVYQIKEIDDEKLTNDYTLEEFEKLSYVYTYLKGGLFKEDNTYTNISNPSASAYYEAPVSLAEFTVRPSAISNQETKTLTMTINTVSQRYNEEKWKNGEFVIELPPEILQVELKNVRSSNSQVEITSYEVYEENGKQYIKIFTHTDVEENYTITINADVTADPRNPTVTKSVKLYAINENCPNYRETSRTADILDINGNGNTSEYVLYKTESLQIIAPTSLLTSQTLSNYDDAGTEVVSPQIAIIDKASNSRDGKINVTVTNNYSGTVSEPIIIGKIPFEGNKYQLHGKDLGSTYSVTMKNTGITVPEAIADKTKVYYSSNSEVTQDITDTNNNWKTAEEVEDWSQIKTYAIDLSKHTLQKGESRTFTYDIVIPGNINYNDVTYSTHAVYFCLDTEDGKLRTKTEVNRLGVMIAKKFDISLTKYKNGTNTKVTGATYKITAGEASRTGTTDENGIARINDLYVDKEYTLKEIQTPDSYILNQDEVKFKITVDESGNPQFNKISGNLKDTANISNEEGKFVLNLSVEDIAKYDVQIIKKDQTTNETLKGVKFRLTGGIYGENGRIFSTNAEGQISFVNLIPGTEYTLQELKATGYYVLQDPVTFTVDRNAEGTMEITSSNEQFSAANIVEQEGIDKAVVNVELPNEPIPTYSLKINKTNNKDEILPGTQFKLTSQDTGDVTYVTTDANGQATIDGLYQFVEGKYVTGEYIIQEIMATGGYITDNTEVKFKAKMNEDGTSLVVEVLEGQDVVVSQEADASSITLNFTNKPIFKLTKTGDNDIILPNAKFQVLDLNGNLAVDAQGNPIGKLEGQAPVNLTFTSVIGTTSNTNTTDAYLWKQREDGTWESGIKGLDNKYSIMNSNEFTLPEAGKLTFEWAQNSEANYDYLTYRIYNATTGSTTPVKTANSKGLNSGNTYETLKFTPIEIELPAGKYTMQFEYHKDGSSSNGLDAGFVRNVKVEGSGYYYLETDENGELTADLPQGLYKVIEIEAPEGYELPENEEDRTYYVGIGQNRPEESEFKVEWAKSVTGLGHSNLYDIKATQDGGYVVAGNFAGACDVDGDGTAEITAAGNFDGLVAKFDKDGNLEWKHTNGTVGADEYLTVAIAADGGYIAAGYEYSDNFENGLLTKLDASGNIVWKKTVESTLKDELRTVDVLSNGDIITGGRFYGETINLGGTEDLTNKGNYDGFIACYGPDGTFKWQQGIQGTNNVNVTSVVETASGIAVAVDFLGTITVNEANVASSGNQDALIIGYSLDGGYQWQQKIGGSNDESIIKLVTDSEDNIIALGGFASNLTLGEDTITAPTTSYSNALLVKYSPVGEYISNMYFGGTSNDDKLTSAVPTDDGGLLIAGWIYNSNIDIDHDGTNDITSNKGCNDGILVKLDEYGDMQWSRTVAGTGYDPIYGVAQLADKGVVAVGDFDSAQLSSGKETNILACQGYSDGFMIKFANVVTAAEIPALQEVNATNELKKFKVTTEIAENSDGERAGGTITGTATDIENINLVEEIKYKYNGQIPVVITPDQDYSIFEVQIDGEKITQTPAVDGSLTLPVFEDITENHHIKVIFEKNLSGVLVHHYLKDRDGNYTTTKLAEDEYQAGKIGSSYTTSPKIDITGYELEKKEDGTYNVPENSSGVYTQDQIEVIYYYEEKPVVLTVHHYLEGTENSLVDDETSTHYKGESYETSPNSGLLENYTLVEELTTVKPETATVSGTIQEDTVVTYYYKLIEHNITTKVADTTVRKYNENTHQTEEITVKGGHISGENETPYETVSHGHDSTKEVKATPDDGYRVKTITINGEEIEFTENDDRTVTIDNFTNVTEDKEIIVEFEPLYGTITVHHYIENTTNQVPLTAGGTAQDEHKTGFVGDPYATKARDDIAIGYELLEIPSNSSGNYEEGNIEITYYYKERKTSVLVHHYLENTTTSLSPDATIDGLVGDNYTTEMASLDAKYELVAVPSNANGTMVEDQTVVTYYYRLKDTSVLVHHYIEGTTTSLSDDVTINGKVDDDYETTVADDIPSKYELVETPENSEGTMTIDQIVVTYYYRLKETGVIVHHYKEGTTESLSQDVTINGRVDDTYTTTAASDIPSKYELVAEPDNKNGTMTESQIVVIYYYRLKDTSVLVHHYIENTTTSLSDDVTIEGQVDDSYTTTVADDIPSKYELVSEPDNKNGSMTESQIVVTYYYRLKDTSVLVHHYKEGTTDKLSNDVTIEGQVDDEYKTTIASDIPSKYELVEEPDNKNGTMTEDQIVVTYYYRL